MPQAASDEAAFRQWYAAQSKKYDLNPDPDDPRQFYDYRAAFRAGAQPDASKHWPSEFKRPGHQNEVVGGFNTRTGERVIGTPRANERDLVRMGWDAASAKRLAAMPEPQDQDLDAIAKKYGGTVSSDEADALAKKYGGTIEGSGDSSDQSNAATGPKLKPQGVVPFVTQTIQKMNPLPLLGALMDSSQATPEELVLLQATPFPGLGHVVRGVVQNQQGEWKKAKEAYDKGNYGDAAMYAISTYVPVFGPMTTGFGEKVKEGDYTGAASDAAALLAPARLSKLKIAPKRITPALKNPNPQEALALQYAQSQGIPMDAGTVTGSPVVRGAQYVADRTLAAAPSVAKATERQTDALRKTASDLSARAGAAETPQTAGEAVKSAAATYISTKHAEAGLAYDTLRQLERQNPQAFVVDVSAAKSQLQPILDRMKRQMPITQQQASVPLKALEELINGPDQVPLSVLDTDLSSLKKVARGAASPELRDLSQGVAAKVIGELDRQVQATVARAGLQARQALQTGRQATRAKYLAADIADDLAKEPVKAYRQATQPKDAGIAQLRELQAIAPNELHKIGRAFLEDLFEPTMREGGFQKAGTAFEKWESMGPQTKALIVPDVRLRTQITRFLQAAKKLQENPNPSGSGGIVSIGSQLGSFALNVPAALTAQVGGVTLSRALRNPRVLQLLTDGLTIKPGTATSKAWLLTMANLMRQDDKKDANR